MCVVLHLRPLNSALNADLRDHGNRDGWGEGAWCLHTYAQPYIFIWHIDTSICMYCIHTAVCTCIVPRIHTSTRPSYNATTTNSNTNLIITCMQFTTHYRYRPFFSHQPSRFLTSWTSRFLQGLIFHAVVSSGPSEHFSWWRPHSAHCGTRSSGLHDGRLGHWSRGFLQ